MAATKTARSGRPQNVRRPSRPRAQEYVYGNTVRRPEPEEDPRQPSGPRRAPGQTRANHSALRRNREKALSVDLPLLVLLTVAATAMLLICVNFLRLQSEIDGRMDDIKRMEQQLEVLRSENDALETRINTSMNLDHVYQVAVNELGMVYASRDQVLLYDKSESEYVRQDEDIPKY